MMGESTSPSTLNPSSSRRRLKKFELSLICASFVEPTSPPSAPEITLRAASACAAHGGDIAEANTLPGACCLKASTTPRDAAT